MVRGETSVPRRSRKATSGTAVKRVFFADDVPLVPVRDGAIAAGMQLLLLTAATMVAFAANSILTRAALEGGHVDPAGFAILRVLAGAATLGIIVARNKTHLPLWRKSRIAGAVSLTAYMIGFSLAYLTLDAGLGALILFGTVQLAMFCYGAVTGDMPTGRQLTGAGIAFTGLVIALWPGQGGQADGIGAAWMVLAGLGWAAYTIAGRRATDPLAATGANFLLCLPVLSVLLIGSSFHVNLTGIALATVCGAVTSGLGYALWYRVLPQMSGPTAAIVQLSVPIIAILAGVALLGEALSGLIIVSAMLVLGGIAFAVRSKRD